MSENTSFEMMKEMNQELLNLHCELRELRAKLAAAEKKVEAYEAFAHWVSMKENTYTKKPEMILAFARCVLSVVSGYGCRIPDGYDGLLQEVKDDWEEQYREGGWPCSGSEK